MPQEELETTWNGIRAELRRSVADLTFHLWLAPLTLAGHDGELLYVRAPRHSRTLVEERYLPLVRSAAERTLGTAVMVEIVAEDWVDPERGRRGAGATTERAGTTTERAGTPREALNPKYSFDQFVIGDGNRLAHAAALAVAEQPAQAYNPLFLYGPPGLGKTHLLHAIGNFVQLYGGGLSVRYATSDEFTSGYVRAVRSGGMDVFKTAFRDVDLLLLDDVQFLAERERTQEELFHTFNALYEGGCQLVVSSDRPPAEMSSFERRLTERFASGLVAELEPLEPDVRFAILRKRVALDGLDEIDEETLREVADYVGSSVRALEGALIRVVAYASLRGETISPDLARRVLARLYPRPDGARCSIEDVKRATAGVFDVSLDELVAKDRKPHLTFPRQVAMYLARELTSASLPVIGAGFGGRNHSTVLHAHRRIVDELAHNEDATRVIDHLRSHLADREPDRGR